MHKEIKEQLSDLYELISQDMDQEELTFFNDLVNIISKEKNSNELKLTNLVAVINGQTVINENLKSLMKKTEFGKKYGVKGIVDLFSRKMRLHIAQAKKLGISDFQLPIMLTSISSVQITPEEPITNIPGSGYHRDGGGKPLSTKITQTENKVWTGGELSLARFVDKSPRIGKSSESCPGEARVCLEQDQSIVFDNRRLLHAVNPNLSTKISTRRTIYQERMNDLPSFDTNLLSQFGSVPIPRNKVSVLASYLSTFLNPKLLPQRYRDKTSMTNDELTFITSNETPQNFIREELVRKHGNDFSELAKQLDKDGILILPELLNGELLNQLQDGFEKEIAKKIPDPKLKQCSFNAAVDSVDKGISDAVQSLGLHAPIQALIQYHLGQGQVALASWRGYRLEPKSTVHYRAWDWHNDQKALGPYGEVKIMILLTDLNRDGQAMRVSKGSHLKHWDMPSQKFTKYNFDEALSYSTAENQGATICYGRAGTIIVFDTNVAHAGYRNLSLRRDVITINFVPAVANSPIMLSGKAMLIDSRQQASVPPKVWQSLAGQCIKSEHDSTSEETKKLRKEYYRAPKFEKAKERFFQESGRFNFFEALLSAIMLDLAADLDLPIRFGAHDVQRDKQFVAFRDAGLQHPQYRRLQTKLLSGCIKIEYNIDIDSVRSFIRNTLIDSEIFYSAKSNEIISSCMGLLKDLHDAVGRNDSAQRLRTNLIYIYFSIERIYQELLIINSWPEISDKLNQYMNTILNMYVNAVYFDDLNASHEDLEEKTSLGMKY